MDAAFTHEVVTWSDYISWSIFVCCAGTSNWSADYFVNTAGSALVVNQTSTSSSESTVREQLQAVFERDWDSPYSTPLNQDSNLEQICEM